MRGVVKYSLVLWALGTSVAHADATLVYQLTESGAEPVEKRLSISHFFVRVDDPSEKDRYLLFQAGKFFPLYRVDESQRTYTLLTPRSNPPFTRDRRRPPRARLRDRLRTMPPTQRPSRAQERLESMLPRSHPKTNRPSTKRNMTPRSRTNPLRQPRNPRSRTSNQQVWRHPPN